nr:hypothetical protein F8B05_19340 [Acinetobacter baumannii]
MGVDPQANRVHRQVSFIQTHGNGSKTVRIVEGKLLNDFMIDYSKPLGEIKDELEQLLDYWNIEYSEYIKSQLGYFPRVEEIIVYEGSNHIDIVLKGKGTLGWLSVKDHFTTTMH